MSDLKSQLIKLGSTNPELRPHIREIIAAKDVVASKGTLRDAMKAYEQAVLVALLKVAKRMPHVWKAQIGTNYVALEMDGFDGLEASEWTITVDVEGDGTTISYWRQEAPFVAGRGQNPHTVDTYGYSEDKTIDSMIRDMQVTLATKRF